MSVENTERRSPAEHLLGAMVEGSSNYIEGMEREGARQIAQSDLIPVEGLHHPDPDSELERLGFVLGEVVEGDPLFRHCVLPAGWSRRETDHSMWTEIVDGTGRARVNVFYKAAFYDRKAHFSIAPLDQEAPR